MSPESSAISSTAVTPSDADTVELRARLERAVARVCPPWLSARSDDLVQVAVMRILDIQRSSQGERTFSASYLWKVAYCALIDEIRRVRRRRETPLEGPDDGGEGEGGALASTLPAAAPDPERRAAGHQIGRGIRECLGRMVRPRRLAVVLHLQGHTVPEASRLLEWRAKRTENLLYRGLGDLRRCLSAKGLAP